MKRDVQETTNELSDTKTRLETTLNEHKRTVEECDVLQQQLSELQKYKIENENTLKVTNQPQCKYKSAITTPYFSTSVVHLTVAI